MPLRATATSFEVETRKEGEVVDVTRQVREAVAGGARDGLRGRLDRGGDDD
jgi:thiamine phosphate synthase YjbQ (UPF0047 family)